MNHKGFQKYSYSLVMALMLIAISGLVGNVRAQDWNRHRWEDQQRHDVYSNGGNNKLWLRRQ